VKQLRASALDARFLFLAPPSLAELERRLRARGTDSEAAVARRLESAGREVEFAEGNVLAGEKVYDKMVVNDVLETAYREVEQFCLEEVQGEAKESQG
jgi:guanylate kinase